jgi:hypothetical protein
MRYVRYVGLAHQRQISAHDWAQVGIKGETVVWNAFNGFSVPLDRFTDEQIDRAIKSDGTFVITGEGEDNQDEFKPDTSATRDMTPQEFEATRIDILAPDDTDNASTPGSEASTARPARTGGTGRGTAGSDS